MEIPTNLPTPIKSILRKVGAKSLLNRAAMLVYPVRTKYDVNDTTAEFYFNTRGDRLSVSHDIKSERSVIADILNQTKSDDIVYDVGANVGTYSCFIANKLVEGKIIAFEPHPRNVERLKKNASINPESIEVRSIALGSEDGENQLAIDTTKTHHLGTGDETITVPVARGDALVKNGTLPTPNIVKIDVEGAELHVVQGLQDVLARQNCRIVYCEVHPESAVEWGLTPAEVDALEEELRNHGFQLEVIRGPLETGLYTIRAVKSGELR